MTKSVSRAAAQKKRNANPKTASKSTAKVGNRHRKPAAKVAAEMVRETHRKTTALFEQFPGTQVPDTFRVLAESNVAHTRELYEDSKNTLQAVLESWQKSFGAAGQGVVALNRRFIDLAERNINTGFDSPRASLGRETWLRSWNCSQPIGARCWANSGSPSRDARCPKPTDRAEIGNSFARRRVNNILE